MDRCPGDASFLPASSCCRALGLPVEGLVGLGLYSYIYKRWTIN